MSILHVGDNERDLLEWRALHTPPKPPMPKTMEERDTVLEKWFDKNWEWQSLIELFKVDALTPEYLQQHLLDAWSTVEWPLSYNGSKAGRWGVVPAMFRMAGFVTDDDSMQQPTGPLTIYRGCVTPNIDGMSWTLDHERAHWFATRFPAWDGSTMAVATLTVEPKRVLGIATGRNESEVIIDPRRFDWQSVAVEIVAR